MFFGAIGAAIVWPFERALSIAARKFVRVAGRIEGVESLVVAIGWALAWPVRSLWSLVQAAAVAVVPRSARHALGMPFRAAARLGRSSGKALVRLAEILNLDGFVLRLVRWTRPIWYPLAALGGFFQAWLATRNYRELLWGMPVVVVLLPLVGIAGWTMLTGRGSIAAQYRLAAKEARQAKDFERVRLFERKLAQLGVSTQYTQFQTALALAQDGRLGEAYEVMKELAPVDESGYPQAHYWIVEQITKGNLPVPADEGHRLVQVHLDSLETLGARGPQMDLHRAAWLVRDRQAEKAAELLEPIARRYLPAALMRMEVNLQLKKVAEARADARLVRTHMEDHTRRGATLSADEYRFWAVAEELLGNLTKAHELVGKWIELEPENAAARAILAELSWRLFEKALAAADPGAEHLAALFLEAAEVSTDLLFVQQQTERLFGLRTERPVINDVIRLVGDAADTSASVLEALGTMAAKVGELDQAREYLRRATSKDEQNAVAWNNYAWITVQLADGDVQEALAAVNKALVIKPDDYRFRETRGQILVRLGRWQDAVADLEFAVNGMPNTREIHMSLAKAYDALGDKQLAQVHREQGD